MRSVSLVEFRRDAEKILAQVRKGQRMVLTRRGKPVARLEPVSEEPDADDPFYTLGELASAGGGSLGNAAIDEILYGS